MRNFALCFLLTIAPAVSPALSQEPLPGAVGVQRVGESPAIGVEAHAEVGEVVYAKFDYLEYTSGILRDSFNHKTLTAKWHLPAGSALYGVIDTKGAGEERVKYCSSFGARIQGGEFGVCFRDSNGDGLLDQFASLESHFIYNKWKDLKDSTLAMEARQPGPIDVGFKRELVYSGNAGATTEIGTTRFRSYCRVANGDRLPQISRFRSQIYITFA